MGLLSKSSESIPHSNRNLDFSRKFTDNPVDKIRNIVRDFQNDEIDKRYRSEPSTLVDLRFDINKNNFRVPQTRFDTNKETEMYKHNRENWHQNSPQISTAESSLQEYLDNYRNAQKQEYTIQHQSLQELRNDRRAINVRIPEPIQISSEPVIVKGAGKKRTRGITEHNNSEENLEESRKYETKHNHNQQSGGVTNRPFLTRQKFSIDPVDGLPLIEGVRVHDDETDVKVWRNARVINNQLRPYKPGYKPQKMEQDGVNNQYYSGHPVYARKDFGPFTKEDNFQDQNANLGPFFTEDNRKSSQQLYSSGGGPFTRFDNSKLSTSKLIDYIKEINAKESVRDYFSARSILTPENMQEKHNIKRRMLQQNEGTSFYPISGLYKYPTKEISDDTFTVRNPVLQYAHPELGLQSVKLMNKESKKPMYYIASNQENNEGSDKVQYYTEDTQPKSNKYHPNENKYYEYKNYNSKPSSHKPYTEVKFYTDKDYTNYPLYSSYTSVKQNLEKPFWYKIAESIKEYTRPMFQPLVEVTEKIGQNLGFGPTSFQGKPTIIQLIPEYRRPKNNYLKPIQFNTNQRYSNDEQEYDENKPRLLSDTYEDNSRSKSFKALEFLMNDKDTLYSSEPDRNNFDNVYIVMTRQNLRPKRDLDFENKDYEFIPDLNDQKVALIVDDNNNKNVRYIRSPQDFSSSQIYVQKSAVPLKQKRILSGTISSTTNDNQLNTNYFNPNQQYYDQNQQYHRIPQNPQNEQYFNQNQQYQMSTHKELFFTGSSPFEYQTLPKDITNHPEYDTTKNQKYIPITYEQNTNPSYNNYFIRNNNENPNIKYNNRQEKALSDTYTLKQDPKDNLELYEKYNTPISRNLPLGR